MVSTSTRSRWGSCSNDSGEEPCRPCRTPRSTRYPLCMSRSRTRHSMSVFLMSATVLLGACGNEPEQALSRLCAGVTFRPTAASVDRALTAEADGFIRRALPDDIDARRLLSIWSDLRGGQERGAPDVEGVRQELRRHYASLAQRLRDHLRLELHRQGGAKLTMKSLEVPRTHTHAGTWTKSAEGVVRVVVEVQSAPPEGEADLAVFLGPDGKCRLRGRVAALISNHNRSRFARFTHLELEFVSE